MPVCNRVKSFGGEWTCQGELESGFLSPWQARELAVAGFSVVYMDPRKATDAG
jgi:hypothetical protein